MSKPWIHSLSSAKRFGGIPEDYLAIHSRLDSSKSSHALNTHRAVFHSAFGIFIIEEIFGLTITNSDGKEVSVRDVAEQHVIEDLGWIPSLSDWLGAMRLEPWMLGPRGRRPDRPREVPAAPEEPDENGSGSPDTITSVANTLNEVRD